MLFINGVRERAELAVSALRIAVGDSSVSARDEDNNLRFTENGVEVISNIMFTVQDPEDTERGYNRVIRMPNIPSAVASSSWMRTPEPADARIGLNWLKTNRLNYITWVSYIAELRKDQIETQLSYELSVGSGMDSIELDRWRFQVDRTIRQPNYPNAVRDGYPGRYMINSFSNSFFIVSISEVGNGKHVVFGFLVPAISSQYL
jgi:hypothetical protein